MIQPQVTERGMRAREYELARLQLVLAACRVADAVRRLPDWSALAIYDEVLDLVACTDRYRGALEPVPESVVAP